MRVWGLFVALSPTPTLHCVLSVWLFHFHHSVFAPSPVSVSVESELLVDAIRHSLPALPDRADPPFLHYARL